MKVLMATDGSKHAARALTTACRILSARDREIDLLCVVPPAGIKGQGSARSCAAAPRAFWTKPGLQWAPKALV